MQKIKCGGGWREAKWVRLEKQVRECDVREQEAERERERKGQTQREREREGGR